jgi:outer membrane protein TolC
MSTSINLGVSFIIGMATIIFTVTSFQAAAQAPDSLPARGQMSPSILDAYINEAFQNNEGLHEQQFGLEKSLYALDEAHSLFLPNISLQSSYTGAAGGRAVDLPLGDLLNGAYATLNKLTASHNFPQLSNQTFLLNPNNFYDAHVHTTLPLINAELWYNKQIKKELITAQQAVVNVYKRELAKNIKTAYFEYYRAVQAVSIYTSALDLVKENIRVNESMLRNGVRNSTALTRSETEQQRTISERLQAENNALNAKAYFNFLLNRNGKDSIILDTALFTQTDVAQPSATQAARSDVARHGPAQPGPTPSADTAAPGVSNREELTQWRTIESVNTLSLRQEKSYLVPKLNSFLDLGAQGEGTVDNKSAYYFAGISLEWDLFAGGQHRYRAKQADADRRSAVSGYNETVASLQLQLEQSLNNYHSATATYRSATAQLDFALKYFTDQSKAYREGQILYVELLDAQNQLTEARLQVTQAYAGVQIAGAQLERDQATYPINPKS